MLRTHKIRLNPMPEQATYFRKAAGIARFVFNWGLAEVKRALADGRKPEGAFAVKKRFNALKAQLFPWSYEVTKCAVEAGFQNLSAALANFWQSRRGQRKGKRMGFPNFKSKKRGPGSFSLANDKFRTDGYWLVVPK